MADFLDKLVIYLGFDASDLEKGQKEASAAAQKTAADVAAAAGKGEAAQTASATRIVKALERIADQGDKLAGEQEQQHRRIAESTNRTTLNVEALARRFLTLYAIVTAGRGLKEFVSDLTTSDSALGRTARNIDVTVRGLSTFQLAAEASGGSAAGITGAMQSLSAELQRAALTGQSSIVPAFVALGVNLATTSGKARDVRDIFKDLNRAAQGMDPARFSALAHMAGIGDEGTIALLEKTTQEYDALLAAQEKYAATQADADAAQKRQTGWRELLITSTAIGRTILTALTPAIVSAMKAVQDWANANQDWIRTEIVKKVGEFTEYLKGVDWKAIGAGVQDFTDKVHSIVTAADDAARGVDSNSVLFRALEGLAGLIGVRLLGSVLGLVLGLGRLGSISLPGLLARLGIAGTVATMAEAADAAKGDKAADNDLSVGDTGYVYKGAKGSGSVGGLPMAGGDEKEHSWMDDAAKRIGQFFGLVAPDAKPARPSGYSGPGEDGNVLHRGEEAAAAPPSGGMWAALKRLVGFGDDPKVKDDVATTAKATSGLFDLMRRSMGLGGDSLGGSGTGGGASLGDRLAHGAHHLGGGGWRGNYGQKGWWTDERQSHAVDSLMKNAGLTEDGAKALVARWRFVESAGGPTAVNPSSGAEGIAQWLGSRKGDGSNGTFDQQLDKVARELNGSEGRAKTLLNTPGSEARGASAFERAEGWNPSTATDNFTARVAEGMKHIAHGAVFAAAATSPTPSAAASSAPSDHISDVEVQAARQRILNGSRDPKDHALIGRYLKEQNTPPAATTAPAPHHGPVTNQYSGWRSPSPDGQGYSTTDMRDPRFAPHPDEDRASRSRASDAPQAESAMHALHRGLVAIGHANKLLHHDGAVPVEVTERSAERIGKPFNEALFHRQWGAHHAHVRHALDHAFHHTAGMRDMLHWAALGQHVSHMATTNVDRSSTTTIHGMTINSRATDGPALMADLEKHLARSRDVAQANTGLA